MTLVLPESFNVLTMISLDTLESDSISTKQLRMARACLAGCGAGRTYRRRASSGLLRSCLRYPLHRFYGMSWFISRERGPLDLQVQETGPSDIHCDSLACCLDSLEQQREVSGSFVAQCGLLLQRVAFRGSSISV